MTWRLKEKLRKILLREQGTMISAPGARFPFALLYPNVYNLGMSNLGFHVIYQQLNQRGDVACERFFLPEPADIAEYMRTNTPLMSLENQRPLYEFPLIGVAVSFEMDYFHLLSMLILGKVEPFASRRGNGDPIIIMGGPCATFNPEPLADFVDVCVVGEGEEVIQELVDIYLAARHGGASRTEILQAFAQRDGVYVPRFYHPAFRQDGTIAGWETEANVPVIVRRRWVRDLDKYDACTVVYGENVEFGDMHLVEISRGCGRHCRFCMAGYCFRRPRVRSLSRVLEAVDRGIPFRQKVGLIGAAVSDYPHINTLCQALADKQLQISVASLRADTLTPTLVETLARSGHHTITLAPEAGSDRLRGVINKSITAAHLTRAVRMAGEAGINNVRLYVMVGLPDETDSDVVAVVDMAREIKDIMTGQGKHKGKLTLSINTFVPKPFTPFQWLPMADAKKVRRRLTYIKRQLAAQEILCQVESVKESYIQGVLARGDRRLGAVLYDAVRAGGVRAWSAMLDRHGLSEDFYLFRGREKEEILPWHNLDMGVSPTYLWTELLRARNRLFSPPCHDDCRRCGVCKEE